MGIDNGAVARRFMTEVWGKGDDGAVEELVDPEIVVRDTMGTNVKGIAKVREMIAMMKKSFSENRFIIEDVIVAGDRVVICHTWHGTHKGDFYGVPGTGKTLTNPGCEVLRIKHGKVVEEIGYMDSYAMLQQVGLVPTDKAKLAAQSQTPSPQPPQKAPSATRPSRSP